MAEVSRILLGCSTHYQVLKLDQPDHAPVFIDVQHVRRHYKELAILVHPDKNQATDAEAAFKRLGEAYECLVDEPSQRNYLHQLKVHQPKNGATTTKQKYKYKRKRKTKSEPKSEEDDALPKPRRTPEEIWQAFQREEEELARQQFQAKGFDRVYESTSKRTNAASIAPTIPPEEQQGILDSNLEAKANKWAMWSKPSPKRMRMTAVSVLAQDADSVSTAVAVSDAPTSLIYCMLCRRKFRTVEALSRHETLSKLHLANVQAQ